jgi:cell wall-associated NlpC family hydrolase
MAAAAVALAIVAGGVPSASAQRLDVTDAGPTTTTSTTGSSTTTTTTTTTTTLPPSSTTTTDSSATASTTTTTTVPTSTTSTTTPAGAGVIPPPPPPPAPPATATPAELAQAAALEQQISVQSTVLDQLSDRYDTAHLAAVAGAQRLADAQEKQSKAEVDEALAKAAIGSADQSLHQTALNAYLGVQLLPNVSHADPATEAYQTAIAQVYSGSALETIADRVHDVHDAERHLKQVEQQVEATTNAAQTQAAAAQATDQQAQVAAGLAAAQQTEMVATLSNVQGDLAALIAVQQATLALAAYDKFSAAGTLLFTPTGPLPAPLPQTTKAMSLALAQIGKPYVWGGTGPDTFDCSGLMQWSWANAGISIPRVADDQQSWTTPIPISQVQPGDLVFFGDPAHHVGMYIGNGLMVEAPHTGANVQLSTIWWSDLAGFGRVHR